MTGPEVIARKSKFSVGRIMINVDECSAVWDKRWLFGDLLWKKL